MALNQTMKNKNTYSNYIIVDNSWCFYQLNKLFNAPFEIIFPSSTVVPEMCFQLLVKQLDHLVPFQRLLLTQLTTKRGSFGSMFIKIYILDNINNFDKRFDVFIFIKTSNCSFSKQNNFMIFEKYINSLELIYTAVRIVFELLTQVNEYKTNEKFVNSDEDIFKLYSPYLFCMCKIKFLFFVFTFHVNKH
ncbi:hypothetical protein AGLY_015686 [Aphis glycines]|uniref:Uncharacterized protein n=1 Tax=Aphis glycines TaxID=307491 RepID=A0A6G0T0E0_APHGL|nr:hypothetical protein AGLY_015686 [Aphis glycines]